MPYTDIDKKRRYQREWKRKQPAAILRALGNVCSKCGDELYKWSDVIHCGETYVWITDVLSKRVVISSTRLKDCKPVCFPCHSQSPLRVHMVHFDSQ